MNHQQVFNIAWNGLKAQGWQKSLTRDPEQRANPWLEWEGCARHDEETGRHCAIGFVDAATGIATFGDMYGIPSISEFALCHNYASSPADMERRYREYAAKYELTIPDDTGPLPR